MTIEERDECLAAGSKILSINLEAIAATRYPEQSLQSVTIKEFTLVELFSLLKRAVKQLMNELNSDAWMILPEKITDAHIELNTNKQVIVHLSAQIEYIANSLADKDDFENWISELLFIVRYEMQFGFWDRSKTRVHNPDDLNLAHLHTEVQVLVQSLRHSLLEIEKVHEQANTNIGILKEFTTQKEEQFASLEKTLDSASKTVAAIRDFETEASTNNGKIATLLDQTDKALDASRKKITQDRKTFNEMQEQINLLANSSAQKVNELNGHSQVFEEIIISAREKEQHILAQETEIMRLIGHAADGRLATSFNDREKALNERVNWWRNASVVVVLVAIAWVFFIFYNNPSQDKLGIDWLILLANVVRTSPAFLLVFFCQAQYTKERHIQEEYAFKAAVSRTVTSYADMIGTGEVNERVKMLIETIQRLYIPPVLGKPMKPISIRSRDLAEAAKSMAETAKDWKSTVTDILKSDKLDKSA